jgi:hypothetical protein
MFVTYMYMYIYSLIQPDNVQFMNVSHDTSFRANDCEVLRKFQSEYDTQQPSEEPSSKKM